MYMSREQDRDELSKFNCRVSKQVVLSGIISVMWHHTPLIINSVMWYHTPLTIISVMWYHKQLIIIFVM